VSAISEPAPLATRSSHVAQRWISLIGSAVILALPARELIAVAQGAPMDSPIGGDFTVYRDAAVRWLAGGGFYQPWQLTGHYAIWSGASPILYPPILLILLVPFTVLPAILWWAIPAAIVGWSIWKLQPAPWSWPLMAICLAWPPTLDFVAHGNPDIWALAFLSVGCVTAGPAVFDLLKPMLGLFALKGVRSRRWWLALGAFAILSLPFGLMWLDWVRAVLNSDGSLTYGLQEWPILALPLLAWLGSRLPAGAAGTARAS
jgi:hypothetical protein